MFISAGISAIKYAYRSDPYPKPQGYKMANRGHSKGGIEPRNLNHQLALKQAASNPTAGTQVQIVMGDTIWPAKEGWVKMQQVIVIPDKERITIHYVMNQRLWLIDDFKIVRIKPIFRRW